jgi:hypothetical protein
MMRVVFHFASFLSFVLLIACAILWPRSYFAKDEYHFRPRPLGTETDAVTGVTHAWVSQITLSSAKGKFQIRRYQPQPDKVGPSGYITASTDEIFSLAPNRPVDRHWRFAGIEIFDRPRHSFKLGNSSGTFWAFRYLTVPYWLVTSLFALLPIAWGFHLRRRLRIRSRLKRGLCPSCGYDLRSSTNRCPECGALTPSPKTSPSPDSPAPAAP